MRRRGQVHGVERLTGGAADGGGEALIDDNPRGQIVADTHVIRRPAIVTDGQHDLGPPAGQCCKGLLHGIGTGEVRHHNQTGDIGVLRRATQIGRGARRIDHATPGEIGLVIGIDTAVTE